MNRSVPPFRNGPSAAAIGIFLLVSPLLLAIPDSGRAAEPFAGYADEVRAQAVQVVAAAGPGREKELEAAVQALRRTMLARGVLSINEVPNDIYQRASRERWRRDVARSIRAVVPVSALSVPMWSWLVKEDILRFDLASLLEDTRNLAATIRWFGPALMGYSAWAISFLAAAACWFVVWVSLAVFLRALPSLEYDIFRLAKVPRREYVAPIAAFAVFILPMALAVGLAVAACLWLLLATAYLRRTELVAVVWSVLLLGGVMVAGGAIDSLADMSGDVGTRRWLAGEGYTGAPTGSQQKSSEELREVAAPWMVRFATARGEMQAGRPAEAERIWSELLSEGRTIPEVYNNRGIVRAQQGKPNEALADFKAAIERRADDGPSLWNAYQLYLQTFNLERAGAIQPQAWEEVSRMAPFGFRPSEMEQTEWIASALPVGEIWKGYLETRKEWFSEARGSEMFQWFFRPLGLSAAVGCLAFLLVAIGAIKALTAKYWLSSTCRACGLHLLLAGSKEDADLCTPCRGMIGDTLRGGDERERRLQTIGHHARYVRLCSAAVPGSGALWAGKEIRAIAFGIVLSLVLAGVTMTLGGWREGGGLITSLQGMILWVLIVLGAALWGAGAFWGIWSFNSMQQRSNLPMPKR